MTRKEEIDAYGWQGLTNTGVLAVMIGGLGGSSEIGQKVRDKIESCDVQSAQTLEEIDGVGEQTAYKILAALEYGRRKASEKKEKKAQLLNADDVYNTFKPIFNGFEHEEFWVVYMNNAYNIIKTRKIGQGGLTETCVDVRVIMREALLCNASCMIAIHNHPSGNIKPSTYDDKLTDLIKRAGELMRVALIDHIIWGQERYYSYKETGKI